MFQLSTSSDDGGLKLIIQWKLQRFFHVTGCLPINLYIYSKESGFPCQPFAVIKPLLTVSQYIQLEGVYADSI